MGKKSTPKAPKPPDYKELIKEQARQNRVNTTTPYGSSTYSQNEDGTWNQVTTIDPRLDSLFGQQIDMAKTGTNSGDYSQYEDMAMAMARRHLDPVYADQRAQLEQEMSNRGTPVGSEIYADKYKLMSDAQDQGYQDAAFKALQFGTGLRSADDARRLQDYNMIASVLGNVQAQPMQPIDVMGASQLQQNAIMNNYNARMNAANSASSNFWNAGGMLGAAGIGAMG